MTTIPESGALGQGGLLFLIRIPPDSTSPRGSPSSLLFTPKRTVTDLLRLPLVCEIPSATLILAPHRGHDPKHRASFLPQESAQARETARPRFRGSGDPVAFSSQEGTAENRRRSSSPPRQSECPTQGDSCQGSTATACGPLRPRASASASGHRENENTRGSQRDGATSSLQVRTETATVSA